MTVAARGEGKGSGQRRKRLSHRRKYAAEKTHKEAHEYDGQADEESVQNEHSYLIL
jgi:hypothetical protein